jgi:hypothetical protein
MGLKILKETAGTPDRDCPLFDPGMDGFEMVVF